jgi:lysophospholipase L1-like esterase
MDLAGKYKNKYFSILGDSISTLAGYSQPEYAVHYDTARKIESGVITRTDTWWGQVIERLGGELLVNNSISGSTVYKHPDYEIPSYGCSDERTSSLGKAGDIPDVVMVFMGTNDWGYGIIPIDCDCDRKDAPNFSVAYDAMIGKLKKNYPEAEIWCITPFVGVCSRKENFSFPYLFGGRHIKEYRDVVCECAEKNGCVLIDLYNCAFPIDTVEGFHANKEGMKVIADFVIDTVKER